MSRRVGAPSFLASWGGRAMRGFRGSASAALQGSESGRRPPSSELVPLID